MTLLRPHMSPALQRRGKRERTPPSDVREVRLLAPFSGTSPHRISAAALPPYRLYRTNVDHLAPTSMRRCSSGSRFFSLHVLARDWKRLDLMRAHAAYRLPALLRVPDVRRVLRMATPWHHRVSLPTVYRLGLRQHAGRLLHVADRDGQRLLGHVPRGQEAKDRDVPLPPDT